VDSYLIRIVGVTHITHNEPHKEFLVAMAITTSIALAGLYLPVLGFLVSVFIPLPVLFFRSKLGRPRGTLILVAVTLIVGSTMQWRSITSTLFFFELGLVGLILSEVFEMDLSLEKTVAVTNRNRHCDVGTLWTSIDRQLVGTSFQLHAQEP
jgi:hypothetical protein